MEHDYRENRTENFDEDSDNHHPANTEVPGSGLNRRFSPHLPIAPNRAT
jgi:hypothetical protein